MSKHEFQNKCKTNLLTFVQRNFQNFNQTTPQQPGQPNQSFDQQYVNNSSFLDPMQPFAQTDLGQQKSYTGNEFDDEPPLLEGKYSGSQKISKLKGFILFHRTRHKPITYITKGNFHYKIVMLILEKCHSKNQKCEIAFPCRII